MDVTKDEMHIGEALQFLKDWLSFRQIMPSNQRCFLWRIFATRRQKKRVGGVAGESNKGNFGN